MACMSTRRRFLALSSAGVVSTLAPVRLLAQATSKRGPAVFSNATLGAYQQGELTFARFQSVLGSSFRAFLDDGSTVDLMLLTVTPVTPGATATPDATAGKTALGGAAVPRGGAIAQSGASLLGGTATASGAPARPGTSAMLRRGIAEVPVTLTANGQTNCFICCFSSGSTVIPQGSYVLDHGTLGRFAVLLVSSGKVATGVPTCSATFNYM